MSKIKLHYDNKLVTAKSKGKGVHYSIIICENQHRYINKLIFPLPIEKA